MSTARAGLRGLVSGMMRFAGSTDYDLYVVELDDGEILERDGYEIETVGVSHRGPSLAYVLREPDRPGVFDPDKARAAGLDRRPGLRPRAARRDSQRRLARAGDGPAAAGPQAHDLRRHASVRRAAARRRTHSDVLIHEATFAIEEAERAHQTGHSTARRRRASRATPRSSCSPSTTSRSGIRRDCCATRRARSSPTRCCRATSTRSRSRSPSAASRSCGAGPTVTLPAPVTRRRALEPVGATPRRSRRKNRRRDAEPADNFS